jgi:hypothetical protein
MTSAATDVGKIVQFGLRIGRALLVSTAALSVGLIISTIVFFVEMVVVDRLQDLMRPIVIVDQDFVLLFANVLPVGVAAGIASSAALMFGNGLYAVETVKKGFLLLLVVVLVSCLGYLWWEQQDSQYTWLNVTYLVSTFVICVTTVWGQSEASRWFLRAIGLNGI